MKITLRLIASLLLVATLFAGGVALLQVRSERLRMSENLERRAVGLSEDLREPAEFLLKRGEKSKFNQLVERIGSREQLIGASVFGADGELKASTPGLPDALKRSFPQVYRASSEARIAEGFEGVDGHSVYLYAMPLANVGPGTGVLLVLHDADYIAARLKGVWLANFIRLFLLSLILIAVTLQIVRWNIAGTIDQVASWLKRLRLGEETSDGEHYFSRGDVLAPLTLEVRRLARSLSVARAAAEKEAQLRLSSETVWTKEKLREHVRTKLNNRTIFVVSNREPYMHVRKNRKVECVVPPSGLVTALEPVLRACGGMWVAQATGDADRESSDDQGKLKVPPEEPAYTLKRVWLTKEEEDGHYYGFSNEGLWPLCHITHVRPTFRLEDWVHYQRVNQKFADALLEEMEGQEEPVVLIQDYHFALLPLLIREKRPDARIGLFWHIPWPNPESFGICPWKQEILLGMLGADVIGFHIQYHCNNFLDTVDNTLESKINWEDFSVERGGLLTRVRPYPISVGTSEASNAAPFDPKAFRQTLQKEYGITARYLGVGVDRLDYTKGIVERFRAVERLLEKYPEYLGQFTFVELGAPSRTHIQKYHDFISEVEKTVEEINWRFQTRDWKPILFLKAQHSHQDIQPFYRAADVCLVTSLHDGMNLVAKEFVSAKDDETGVLVLSEFTGASRELTDALAVNPYHIESVADVIKTALSMAPEEQVRRMRRMRTQVQERNVYRWAGSLISDLVRISSAKAAAGPPA